MIYVSTVPYAACTCLLLLVKCSIFYLIASHEWQGRIPSIQMACNRSNVAVLNTAKFGDATKFVIAWEKTIILS